MWRNVLCCVVSCRVVSCRVVSCRFVWEFLCLNVWNISCKHKNCHSLFEVCNWNKNVSFRFVSSFRLASRKAWYCKGVEWIRVFRLTGRRSVWPNDTHLPTAVHITTVTETHIERYKAADICLADRPTDSAWWFSWSCRSQFRFLAYESTNLIRFVRNSPHCCDERAGIVTWNKSLLLLFKSPSFYLPPSLGSMCR